MPSGLTMNWWLPLRSIGLAGVRYFPGVVFGVPQLFPLPTNPRVAVAWYQQIHPVWGLPAASVQLTASAKSSTVTSSPPVGPLPPREFPMFGYVPPFMAWAWVAQKFA